MCAGGAGNITIGSNHGHTLTVSQADIKAGVDKTYDITGSSSHPHTVTLTAADFATLAAGQTVDKTSSTDSAHSHSVTVACA